MSDLRLAAVQMNCQRNRKENIEKALEMTRSAAGDGARVVLLPELFETKYFCQERNYDYYNLATTVDSNPAVSAFSSLCRELKLFVPVSFFEKEGNTEWYDMLMGQTECAAEPYDIFKVKMPRYIYIARK